jgi:phosphatidylglycerophosphate synthase
MNPVSDAGGIARRRSGHMLGVFTLIRLLLIPVVIGTFMVAPLLTTLSLFAFMLADLYDGMLARKLGADDVGRRALDSMVDRIAIDACLVAAFFAGALPMVLLCAFLGRDIYLAFVCGRMIRMRRVVIKADLVHRSLSFLFAVWAVAVPFISPSVRTGFALFIFAVAIAVAVDVTRSARVVINAPADVRDAVLVAHSLRKQARWEDECGGASTSAFIPVPAATTS